MYILLYIFSSMRLSTLFFSVGDYLTPVLLFFSCLSTIHNSHGIVQELVHGKHTSDHIPVLMNVYVCLCFRSHRHPCGGSHMYDLCYVASSHWNTAK